MTTVCITISCGFHDSIKKDHMGYCYEYFLISQASFCGQQHVEMTDIVTLMGNFV